MAAVKKAPAATKKSEDDVLAAAMARVQADQGGEPETEDHKHVETAATSKATGKTKPAAKPTVTSKTVPRSKTARKVAYTPLDREDPSFTIFFGMKFDANVERDVTNEECIKLAMQNPWFKVDGKHHAKRVKPQPKEDDEQAAKSGLPEGVEEKDEVEATAEDFTQ